MFPLQEKSKYVHEWYCICFRILAQSATKTKRSVRRLSLRGASFTCGTATQTIPYSSLRSMKLKRGNISIQPWMDPSVSHFSLLHSSLIHVCFGSHHFIASFSFLQSGRKRSFCLRSVFIGTPLYSSMLGMVLA